LRVVALVALLLVTVPRASAEFIQWSYSGSVVTTGPFNSGSLQADGLQFLFGSTGNTSVQFFNLTGKGADSSSVNAFQLRSWPGVDFCGNNGGTFKQNLHTFDLTVGLTDTASGKSGALIFHGGVDGFVNRVSWAQDTSGTGVSVTQLNLSFKNPSNQSLVL